MYAIDILWKIELDIIVRSSITDQSFFDQPNLLNYRYSSVTYVGAGLSYSLKRLMQTIVHTSLFQLEHRTIAEQASIFGSVF